MVGEEGLEPSRIAPLAPKASVYTNFTTRPYLIVVEDYNKMIILARYGKQKTLGKPNVVCIFQISGNKVNFFTEGEIRAEGNYTFIANVARKDWVLRWLVVLPASDDQAICLYKNRMITG